LCIIFSDTLQIMKKTIQIILILISFNSFGQDFDTLSKVQLINIQDCFNSQQLAYEAADYILSIPLDFDKQNRDIISGFLLKWTGISLKSGFEINEDLSGTIKLDQNLMSVYLACITKSIPSDFKTKILYDSIENSIILNYFDYCRIFASDNKDIIRIVKNIQQDNDSKSITHSVKKAPNKTDENGLKQGLWKEHLPEENFEYALINYVDNIREGEFTAYYKNNALYMRGNYKTGKLNGEHIIYYTDGQIKVKRQFTNGLQTGTKYTFNEDGSIYSIVNFKDDKLHGPYYKYDDEGDLKWYIEYENDEEIKVIKMK
ncbi:toxin-antitoxin system YwqK family antitoxin, partial [Saccharicrinis sp. FJH62]|uniref:toxin-antitoxin system YwqK family antitoxin n=1 Tax=Saccharicrinis sp. FJH62 TaxID=3344657 RepID=UPI0035D44C0C